MIISGSAGGFVRNDHHWSQRIQGSSDSETKKVGSDMGLLPCWFRCGGINYARSNRTALKQSIFVSELVSRRWLCCVVEEIVSQRSCASHSTLRM